MIWLEKCDYDLSHYLFCDGIYPLSLAHAIKLTQDIVRGLASLYHRKLHHHDISPKNIMINVRPTGPEAKIGDFDMTLVLQKNPTLEMTSYSGGTPFFQAPEVEQGKQHNYVNDIFSIGCVLYYLLFRKDPSNAVVLPLLWRNFYTAGNITFNYKMNPHICSDLVDFIMRCLVNDPGKRWHLDEMVAHNIIKRKVETFDEVDSKIGQITLNTRNFETVHISKNI